MHFAGDEAMILFNAPALFADHELQVIRMTLSMPAPRSNAHLLTNLTKRAEQKG